MKCNNSTETDKRIASIFHDSSLNVWQIRLGAEGLGVVMKWEGGRRRPDVRVGWKMPIVVSEYWTNPNKMPFKMVSANSCLLEIRWIRVVSDDKM